MLVLTSTASSSSHALRVSEDLAPYPDTRPTVYLDTTICSYLTARSRSDPRSAERQAITREWWECRREFYRLCISERVTEEASRGRSEFAERRAEIIQGLWTLDVDSIAEELSHHLIGRGLLPPSAKTDAEHIAIAAKHSVRYLLTWNFRHLANPQIAEKIVRKCESLGFHCPEICTPEQLMKE